MISSEELAFVRLAMRKRLLRADQVKEAVERKKWDNPDLSLRSILVDMGALGNDQVVEIRDQLRGDEKKRVRARKTQLGRDTRARESDEEHGVPAQLGNYKLLKLLGAGAMGAVYDAVNVELERRVALKILLSDGVPSPRAVQRFKREARLAARLDHPNVVRVHEAGQEQGYHFIVMDMVKGHSVAELITLGELTPRRSVHLMRRVAEAVAYAHEKDVIHRDLKPANILVEEQSGEARVTDYGLAVLAEGGEDDRLTRTGAAVGTPAYMAPEQVRGQLDKIDGRTDVYALGATFYEMLTSSPPFEATTFLELAKKICDQEPTAPRKHNREVPLDVETICLKALEKRPEDRYQSAADMARDLAHFLDDSEIVATRPSIAARLVRFGRRRPALLAGLVGFLVVVLGAAGFYLSLPGVVEISSNPSGAVVLIDGEEAGTTPERPEVLRLELPAGRHQIRFRKQGYLEIVPGLDTIQVGHSTTVPVPVSLVSEKGLVQVPKLPFEGARLRLFAQGQSEPLREASPPFADALPQGTYELELSAPGYRSRRTTITVSAGGLAAPWSETKLETLLEVDPTRALVRADPEQVTLSWSRAEGSFKAPLDVRGAGEHVLVARKPGYLPRRRTLYVREGSVDAKLRISLPPLVAARRPLEGRVLGEPLVADIDGDGAVDLMALEASASGRRLVFLPGMGAALPRYRAPTVAERLIGAVDLDLDGDLDVVCGNEASVEVREALTGTLLKRLPLDARRVSLLTNPPRLAYLGFKGRLHVQPLSLLGSRPWPVAAPGAQPPVVLAGGLLAAATADRLIVRPLGAGAPKTRRIKSADPANGLLALRLGERAGLLAIPRKGTARVCWADGAVYELGTAESRFVRGSVLDLGVGSWAFLAHADGRVDAYRIGDREATLDPGIRGAGLPVVLVRGERSLVWTSTGALFQVSAGSWKALPDLSTDAASLLAPHALAQVADLDGDGEPEIAAVGRDRSAILVLEPDGSWLRWRSTTTPGALVPVGLGPGPLGLAVVQPKRVRFLAGDDGRELSERVLELPGAVLSLAAGPPDPQGRSVFYVGFRAPKDAQARLPGALQRFQVDQQGWRGSWSDPHRLPDLPWGLRVVSGRKAGVLVTPPLAFVETSKGVPRDVATDKLHTLGTSVTVSPAVAVGATSIMGIASRRDKTGREVLVGYDLISNALVERALALGSGAPSVPLRVSAAERLVAAEARGGELQVFRASDLRPLTRIQLKRREPVGLVLSGGKLPRLLVTTRAGNLIAFDPESGHRVWQRSLAAGAQAPSAPVLVKHRDFEAVAVVAPSGVLLLFDLDSGAYLGERRAPEGAIEELVFLPGREGVKPALLLRTSAGRSLVVVLPSLRPRAVTPRQRVQALRASVRAGGRELAGALRALEDGAVEHREDPLWRLALAEAHLNNGAPAAALAALENSTGRGSPAEQRVRILATYLNNEEFLPVAAALRELAKSAPRLAADVALQLTQQRDANERALVELATRLDERYAKARAEHGRYLLRKVIDVVVKERPEPEDLGPIQWHVFTNRWWKGNAQAMRNAFIRASEARLSLTFALQLEDDPRSRAGAIVACALERALLRKLGTLGQKGTQVLYDLAGESQRLLTAGGPTPSNSPPVLKHARKLLNAHELDPNDRSDLLIQLYGEERDWLVPLTAVQAFTGRP